MYLYQSHTPHLTFKLVDWCQLCYNFEGWITKNNHEGYIYPWSCVFLQLALQKCMLMFHSWHFFNFFGFNAFVMIFVCYCYQGLYLGAMIVSGAQCMWFVTIHWTGNSNAKVVLWKPLKLIGLLRAMSFELWVSVNLTRDWIKTRPSRWVYVKGYRF